jgi:hypothetical protein
MISELAVPGATAAGVAAACGLSHQAVSKAAWLARRYPQSIRDALGIDQVLSALGAGHLEVVAALPDSARFPMLRRAAHEGMTVRQLRSLAKSRSASGGYGAIATSGSAADLASAQRAVEAYVRWDEGALSSLFGGPNGPVIIRLALAGKALADRMGLTA